MSFFKHLARFAAEMTMQRDPYPDEYVPPRVVSEYRDECGHVVKQIVTAQNQRDATRHLDGITIQGDRSIVASRIGHNKWDVHVEDWDKGKKGKGMEQSDGYDTDAWWQR